jgi:hypothetical protein
LDRSGCPPSRKSLDKTVELIVNRLHSAAPEIQPVAASPTHPPWPNEPTPFDHGLADRVKKEWPAIQKLMTANAAKRILIFKGPSGYSKSALLEKARFYAKECLGFPAAYVDFKALPNRIDVLRELQDILGAILPNFAKQEEPDSRTFLRDLHQLGRPALILLDTYEKIKETKELVEWIEFHLLAKVIECKQLRFLVGGQKVPERPDARWRDLAEEIELDRIDDNQTWMEWIRQKNPHVDDKHVEGIVKGLKGAPNAISAALENL